VLYVDRDRFEELVADALDLVPERFAEALDEVAVVVEPRAPRHLGSLYGLYQGVPRTRPEGQGWMEIPARISIYMHPLLDVVRSEAELVEQVRITVLHELGHHLGMDEDQLEELGYG
jgi:predicted Zn-dependent protease with MMP-like domain